MPKKKCPACGSTDTVKILYGEPTYEAYEASERGELVLGGCCISNISPTRHCKECGQEFGGEDLFPFFEIHSFEFFIGGYFGTSHFIYIDGRQENKCIKYAKTPGGMYVDLKQANDEFNVNPDVHLKEIPLTTNQWLEFTDEIARLEVACWKDRYSDNEICDGTQWELTIKFPHQNEIIKSGSNEYPPHWKRFIKIMKKYIDEDIG